ncbi:MAG: AAA family ATPase [bacterium]
MRIIAIANQKGGCGKTTTAINLSACLAIKSRRVLLIDLDPQCHATVGVGLAVEEIDKSIYDVLMGSRSLDNVVLRTESGFDVAPSSIVLSVFEQKMAGQRDREKKLSTAVGPISDSYDYVVIDCPPSIGLLTFNALVAAKEVIIPIESSFFSLWGIGRLLDMIDVVRDEMGKELRLKVVCTMFDGRSRFSQEVVDDVRRHFKDSTYSTIIHMNVKLREAASFGKAISQYDRKSRGYKEYLELAREVLAEEDEVSVAEAVKGAIADSSRDGGPIPVAGGILFRISAPYATKVQLAGDFNSWQHPIELNDDDGDGIWITIARLDPGTYQYKFIVDGEWKPDPTNRLTVDDAHGGLNSIVIVK